MGRCWEAPGPTRRFLCRPLAKRDPYVSAEEIVEKRSKQCIKNIKEEGQASWQSATAADCSAETTDRPHHRGAKATSRRAAIRASPADSRLKGPRRRRAR